MLTITMDDIASAIGIVAGVVLLLVAWLKGRKGWKG